MFEKFWRSQFWLSVKKIARTVELAFKLTISRVIIRKNKKKYRIDLPNHELNMEYLINNKEKSTITWIGHASFLLQTGGLNILTDPIIEDKVFGIKRYTPASMTKEDLQKLNIDVVIISHNHYDHLSIDTLKKIKGNPLILVPKGDAKLLINQGFKNVEEFDRWNKRTINDIALTFVPTSHNSGRYLFGDINKSLWGGWMIENSQNKEKKETIYFGGDSAYFEGFKELGKKYNVDYALLGIGCYKPEKYLKSEHMSPEDATKAFIDLNAEKLIPMHYGAFNFLSSDKAEETLEKLNIEWTKFGLEKSKLNVILSGDTIEVIKTRNEKKIENLVEVTQLFKPREMLMRKTFTQNFIWKSLLQQLKPNARYKNPVIIKSLGR